MEYLVTMTTTAPRDASQGEIADMRAREAEHTKVLAQQGQVLRLWRPPQRPEEWRTIGLFSARNFATLEQTLIGMPLHAWRTDRVAPLGPHREDPGRQRSVVDPYSTEFMTTWVLSIPVGVSLASVRRLSSREAERTRTLADEGRLLRLWSLPGRGRQLGLWQAQDSRSMQLMLRSLPIGGWLSVDTVRLNRHPSDPVTTSQESTHQLTGQR